MHFKKIICLVFFFALIFILCTKAEILPIDLSIQGQTAAQGQVIEVPVTISANSNASVGTFRIEYDCSVLEYMSMVRTGCVSLGNSGLDPIIGNPDQLGFYFISKNLGTTPLTAGGNLFYLRFAVKEDAPNGSYPISIIIPPGCGLQDMEGNAFSLRIINSQIEIDTPPDGKHIIKTAFGSEGGSSISYGGRYGQGETLSLSATPATGYRFSHWECENGHISNPYSATSTYTAGNENDTIYAHFKLKTFSISASVEGNQGGSIVCDKEHAQYNSSVTVTLFPDEDYKVSAFTVNGKDYLASLNNNTITLNSIRSAQDIKVTYSWCGEEIIDSIIPLRASQISFSNQLKTIDITADITTPSVGFALNLPNDAYVQETGKNIITGMLGDKKYLVAKKTKGENQSFLLYVKSENNTYTYTVNVSFTPEYLSENIISEIIPLRSYDASFNNETRSIFVKASLFDSSAGFALNLSNGSYQVEKGKGIVCGKENGKLYLVAKKSNGLSQSFKVFITTESGYEYTYHATIEFTGENYSCTDVITGISLLRCENGSFSNETRTVNITSLSQAPSCGVYIQSEGEIAVSTDKGIIKGIKDGKLYYVVKRVNGQQQNFDISITTNKGYKYTFNVTVNFS